MVALGLFLALCLLAGAQAQYCSKVAVKGAGSFPGVAENALTFTQEHIKYWRSYDGMYVAQNALKNGKPHYIGSSVAGTTIHIYASEVYAGYWVIQEATSSGFVLEPDNQSYNAFGSAPDAADITSVTFEDSIGAWASATFTCMDGVDAVVKDDGEPTPSFADRSGDLECSAGFTNTYSSAISGCHNACQCEGTSNGDDCKLCCQRSGNSCYRKLGAAKQTATKGFGRSCPIKCKTAWLGDGKCDGVCNNPDCGFDGGDCCSETNANPTGNKPQVCQDPTHSEKHNTWRFEYNVPQCRPEVRNQGNCGSCYAFAASSSMNRQMCRNQVPGHERGLSAQQIESCIHDWQDGGQCAGGYVELSVQGAGTTGLRFEDCFPYERLGDAAQHFSSGAAPAVTCAKAHEAKESTCTAANDYQVLYAGDAGYWKIDVNPANAAVIRKVLRTVGPVPINAKWDAGFDGVDFSKGPGDGGIAIPKFASSGYHSMVLTGYGEYTVGAATKKFWSIENSWGYPSTHDIGYNYLDANADCAGITGYCFITVPSHVLQNADSSVEIVGKLADEADPDPVRQNHEDLAVTSAYTLKDKSASTPATPAPVASPTNSTPAPVASSTNSTPAPVASSTPSTDPPVATGSGSGFDFGTGSGSGSGSGSGDGTGRRLLGATDDLNLPTPVVRSAPQRFALAPGPGIQYNTYDSFHRALLADTPTTVADGLIIEPAPGGFQETPCDDDGVVQAVNETITEISKILSDRAGISVAVDVKDMKTCSSQVISGKKYNLAFSIRVDESFRKDVVVNVTRYDPDDQGCTSFEATESGEPKCLEPLDLFGFKLPRFDVDVQMLNDDGTEDLSLGAFAEQLGLSAKCDETATKEVIVYRDAPKGSDTGISFGEAIGAGLVGCIAAILVFAVFRMAVRKATTGTMAAPTPGTQV